MVISRRHLHVSAVAEQEACVNSYYDDNTSPHMSAVAELCCCNGSLHAERVHARTGLNFTNVCYSGIESV